MKHRYIVWIELHRHEGPVGFDITRQLTERERQILDTCYVFNTSVDPQTRVFGRECAATLFKPKIRCKYDGTPNLSPSACQKMTEVNRNWFYMTRIVPFEDRGTLQMFRLDPSNYINSVDYPIDRVYYFN